MIKFLRTDRRFKDGLQNIPVISILMSQMIYTLQQKKIAYSESLLNNIQKTYKGVCKRNIQTFLAPGAVGVTAIPTRNSSNAVYIRCLQIFRSAITDRTVNLLDSGMLTGLYGL